MISISETNTWSRLEFEVPAPANRLDFALCAVSLSVPLTQGGGGDGDIGDTSAKVSEVMERELKPGSASSRESVSEGSSGGCFRQIFSLIVDLASYRVVTLLYLRNSPVLS